MTKRMALAGWGVSLLAAVAVANCGNTLETVPVAAGGGTPSGTGAGIPGGAGGEAGTGGVAPLGRGDPNDFPTECIETCADACARLSECGGELSSEFPLDSEQCLLRCATSEGGGHWGDNSGHFKCCTTQQECTAVAQCGGWLAHPDAVASCARYCECRQYNSAITALTAGHAAPQGYRFAPDLLWVDVGRVSVDLTTLRTTHVLRAGRHQLLRLDSSATRETVAELRARGRVLPTFVDSAGHISAAGGDLVVIAEGTEALGRALAAAGPYGLAGGRALKAHLTSSPDSSLHLLRGSDPWRTLDAVAALESMPGIRVELDQLRRYEKRNTPNDPLYADQWHLENSGQNDSTASVDARVSEAWDITLGAPSVVVCINDDGVDLNHPDLAGKLEPALGFPADWETLMQQNAFAGHGTSVAGVAAASADNAEGGAGVCPDCRILAHLLGESSGGSFTVSDTEVGQGFIDMVDAGAWVINNSWGYETGDPEYVTAPIQFPPLASVVRAGFDYAETEGRAQLGTIVLFAAGNSNDALDPLTAYDTNVSVSAVDDLGLKPYYSSFGPANDIAAPSNGGMNGITTTAAGSAYTAQFGGTSSACPLVTGVVGLVLSAAPALTAAEVRSVLAQSATKIDPVFGQWDADGHSDFHGAGLVNAYVAVALATGLCATPEDCVAPSDDCGQACATRTDCQPCRTQRDCADGYVCQALSTLGELLCVPLKGSDDCPTGSREVNGYCLPSALGCGICPGTEECNGRDDDCNGAIDDNACQNGAVCFIDGPGCPAGQACVGLQCAAECTATTDCATNQSCETLKDQYGAAPGVKGCISSYSGATGTCESRCEVRASTLDDAGLGAFVDCWLDGTADCAVLDECRQLLPQ